LRTSSGDTKPSDNLVTFTAGVDLLIHEVGRSKQDPGLMEDHLLYVVLEPPPQLARWTYDCRRTWKRVWRPDIPPALGGMGPLSAPLDPRICVAKLEQLCALQPPVSTRFLEPRRFPGHELVYLPPTAEQELEAFATRLTAAGFSMHANPFAHVHHFGVAFFEPDSDECMRLALSTCAPPAGIYRFAFVQLYELSATSIRSLWRGRCAGAKTAD
jgi:hypothetical protein